MVTMDETHAANSSTAAAVADGAGAAVHTKAVEGSPIGNSTSYIKLLIKSSNQQYEDHVIESDLLWTVKGLKSHLAAVYPSKPPVTEQKLIYAGQLLSDNLQLKDVIRNYKDVYTQNHIIHLVYMPKNFQPVTSSKINKTKLSSIKTSSEGATRIGDSEENSPRTANNNMANTDGIRHRQTAGNNNTNQPPLTAAGQQQPSMLFNQQIHPYFMTPQQISIAGITCPQVPQNISNNFGSPYNVQALMTQHTIMYHWMQQVYSHYMEQCLRFSNNAGGDDAVNSSYTAGLPTLPPNFPYLFQQQYPSNVMTPVVNQNDAASSPGLVIGGGERQDQQQQPALAQVAAARFPNLPQDEQENRDWLDNFFSITRLALFLTLLYFNSSPLRCFMVVIIATGIYLYHIGVFRLRHERNNNNLNRNNNAAQNAAVDQIRQGVGQQQNGPGAPDIQENNDNNIGEQPAETTTDVPDNANNESMLSIVRTFVVSFFTSLLPETPAL